MINAKGLRSWLRKKRTARTSSHNPPHEGGKSGSDLTINHDWCTRTALLCKKVFLLVRVAARVKVPCDDAVTDVQGLRGRRLDADDRGCFGRFSRE